MMKRPTYSRTITKVLLRVFAALAVAAALSTQAIAQTPAGTVISNTASASYSDGTNTYTTVSNTVTVTVSNVSGLTITPDAGTITPAVVAGQTNVLYTFTVTNTGNFSDQVRFLAGGASVRVVGSGTVTRAVIDLAPFGAIGGGDTDIKTNASDVLSAAIAQNASIQVLVEVSISGSATTGSTVQVLLGDAATGGPSFDNQPANSSANEVRTVSASSVNGLREARGDIVATVVDDALLTLTLAAPTGPVALGSDITYTWTLNNVGAKAAAGVTLNAATQVYIIAPIPVNTVLKATGQTFPAGTLYSTTALTTAPMSATWSSSAPGTLSTLVRIAFPVGATLAAGATATPVNMIVTVNTGINASIPIDEIGDTFGKNTINVQITDQSGDATPNNGDGNANFNEGYTAGAGHGVIQRTTLLAVGSVLLGPSGAPAAVGPSDNNDDYTNKSSNPGNIAPGGSTTAAATLDYVNTVQNTGNANDIFTLDAPTVPAGFTVAVDAGSGYVTVSGGGSTTVAVNFATSAAINVRITIPVGKTILSGYDTIIRATSQNTSTSNNKTIDRAYTGFIRLDKSFTVTNATGVGAATDPVPGAVINYSVTYTNISSSNGDTNCVKLTASNLVITEDGLAAPNNWGTYTTHSGTAADSGTGVVVTVSATKYTDTVATVGPGVSKIFTFFRTIN